MEAVQLFLSINKPGLDNEWNKQINASLKSLNCVEQVEVIEQNESSNAQINISYNVKMLSFEKIEAVIKSSGAEIMEINIHFSTDVSGVASPYGASALATSKDNDLNNIKGVLGIGISSTGIIKARLDPMMENKQAVIESILRNVHH